MLKQRKATSVDPTRCHPLLQPCMCRFSTPCLTCARWHRIYRLGVARNAARAKGGR
jgi:hypothetical protein